MNKGQVKKFVIQYEIFVGGKCAAVTRFDTFPIAVHGDLILPDGTISKRWYLQLNFDEGLTFAYNDIETNWEKYREWYLSKLGG